MSDGSTAPRAPAGSRTCALSLYFSISISIYLYLSLSRLVNYCIFRVNTGQMQLCSGGQMQLRSGGQTWLRSGQKGQSCLKKVKSNKD